MNEANLELSQKESVNLVHFVNRLVRAGTNKLGASKVDSDFYAFQKSALDAIIGKIDIAAPESVLVVDDAGLQIIQRLVNAGVKNITLAITRLDKDSLIDLSYIIKRRLTKYNWDINLDIRHFEEVMGMNFDLVIANPPYGKIGADITKKVIDEVDFKEYINLEPSNDYFISDLYTYIDSNAINTNEALGLHCFSDANQAVAITKLSKIKNNLTVMEARTSNGILKTNLQVYQALAELFIQTEKYGQVYFKFNGNGKSLKYSDEIFMFNSGGFDMSHGYLAIGKPTAWTASTEYNIFHKETKGNIPYAKIKGNASFKKLIYSPIGLNMLKVWFTSCPEGWGFAGGMFANLDYSDCLTWNDVFNRLGVSQSSQQVLITAAKALSLTDAEKEICRIVAEMSN